MKPSHTKFILEFELSQGNYCSIVKKALLIFTCANLIFVIVPIPGYGLVYIVEIPSLVMNQEVY